MYNLNLKNVCKNKNITISQVALKSGIPQPSLSRYISGRSDITLRQLNRLSYALGVGIKELLQEEDSFLEKHKNKIEKYQDNVQKEDKEWVSNVLWDLRKHYLSVGKK